MLCDMKYDDIEKKIDETGNVTYYRNDAAIDAWEEELDMFLAIKLARIDEFFELFIDREIYRDEAVHDEAIYVGKNLVEGIKKQIDEVMDFVSTRLGNIKIISSSSYQPGVILKDKLIDVVVDKR